MEVGFALFRSSNLNERLRFYVVRDAVYPANYHGGR
jgi:hypothetical protein